MATKGTKQYTVYTARTGPAVPQRQSVLSHDDELYVT